MESAKDEDKELTKPRSRVKDDTLEDEDIVLIEPCTDGTLEGDMEDESEELMEPNTGVKEDATEGDLEVEAESDSDENNKAGPSTGMALVLTNVDANSEPFVGMEFESQWAARSFYNEYAKHVGFATRISYSHRSKRDRKMIGQQYVCVKEGFPVHKEGPSKLPRLSARIGCKAAMTVKKGNNGKWVVKSFEKEHNHELASSAEVEFLQSNRGLSNAAVNLISNIPGLAAHLNNIMSGSSVKSDKEEIASTGLDRKNLGEEKGLTNGDAQAVLDFFKVMQTENPSFFYAIQVDKEDRVIGALWVDARSRMAYDYFGDVLNFDTTYLANKYRVPLVSFVGVNHHLQPVLFGCALLSDATKSSFVWLFKSWHVAMSGRHPVSIITDQDKAIQAAVIEVFPDTNHQFSCWHIRRQLSDKLRDVISTHENFEEEFLKCMYQSEQDDFESSWGSLLDAFGLRKNDWLESLYNDRRYWVPVYLKPTFFAEMPSTLKSEAIESLFDGHMNAETSLEELFKGYNFVLDSWYCKEVQADFETPMLKTTLPFESKAAALYTRQIFDKFQAELFESFEYIPNRVAEDGPMNMYMVAKFGEEKKAHTITFDFNEMRGSCNCRMFEFTGLLCRHILSVLNVENISILPSHYILKRWTREAKSRVMLDGPNVEVPGNSRQAMISRYNDLCHKFVRLAEEGARSIEGYNVAVRALNGTLREVVAVNDANVGPQQVSTPVSGNKNPGKINEGGNMTSTSNLHSPHQSKTKGRTPSRSKAGTESRRMNTCNTCMKPGHNSRTCPTMTNLEQDIVEDMQMGQMDWSMSVPSIEHARQPFSEG